MMGFYRDNARWLAGGLLIAFGSSVGQTYFIALFGADLRQAHGLSHGAFGALYTLATVASATVLIWAGALADHWPVARLAAVAALLLALACLSMGLAEGVVWLGLSLFALRLFGQGMMSHVSMTAMGRWYNRRRGKAVAVASMGYPLGEALLPPLVVALVLWIGWRDVWLVMGAALACVLTPMLVALTRRERVAQFPEDDGAVVAPVTGAAPEPGTEPDWVGAHWTRREALRDPLFWALMPGVLAASFIITGVLFHQTHLVAVKGWTLQAFSTTYALYGACSVAGSLACGWAVDRYTARRVTPISLLPLAAAMVLLASGDALAFGFAAMALSGLSAGLVATLLGALWAELYGTRHLGSIRALTVAAMVFSTALAPGLMGWLIDAGVSLDAQFLAMGLYSLACCGLYRALRPRMMARGDVG